MIIMDKKKLQIAITLARILNVSVDVILASIKIEDED